MWYSFNIYITSSVGRINRVTKTKQKTRKSIAKKGSGVPFPLWILISAKETDWPTFTINLEVESISLQWRLSADMLVGNSEILVGCASVHLLSLSDRDLENSDPMMKRVPATSDYIDWGKSCYKGRRRQKETNLLSWGMPFQWVIPFSFFYIQPFHAQKQRR